MTPKYTMKDLFVIIPAHNEEDTLPGLLKQLKSSITHNIIVVDNASTDQTRIIAQNAGVIVVHENRLGYGNACLAAINYLSSLKEKPKVVCFFDGDGQSIVNDIPKVANGVFHGKIQYCQGSRMILQSSRGRLGVLARVANRFFSFLLSLTYNQNITDLGPLRIVTWKALCMLEMKTPSYGWTMEMSAKILKSGVNHIEIPVSYSQRTKGESKISGNITNAFKAALIMIITYIKILFFWRPTHSF
ncbi:MAG: glycosyltransferase family 2 protein [Candidatus Hodarchaeales archaeon]|jgi:glycosyltransferase involved in cell wall biosynthesis